MTFKKLPDLRPILLNNPFCPQMLATLERLQPHSREFRDRLIGYIRIIEGVKHHDLRSSNFRRSLHSKFLSFPRVEQWPSRPPRNWQSLFSPAGLAKPEEPQRRQNFLRSQTRHTPPAEAKSPPKCQLAKICRQSVYNVQDVQVRRSCQKLPATLPSPTVAGIKHPKSMIRKKFRQGLFARGSKASHRRGCSLFELLPTEPEARIR